MHIFMAYLFSNLFILSGKNDGSTFYTLAKAIMILVGTLERSEGDVFDPIKNIYS